MACRAGSEDSPQSSARCTSCAQLQRRASVARVGEGSGMGPAIKSVGYKKQVGVGLALLTRCFAGATPRGKVSYALPPTDSHEASSTSDSFASLCLSRQEIVTRSIGSATTRTLAFRGIAERQINRHAAWSLLGKQQARLHCAVDPSSSTLQHDAAQCRRNEALCQAGTAQWGHDWVCLRMWWVFADQGAGRPEVD